MTADNGLTRVAIGAAIYNLYRRIINQDEPDWTLCRDQEGWHSIGEHAIKAIENARETPWSDLAHALYEAFRMHFGGEPWQKLAAPTCWAWECCARHAFNIVDAEKDVVEDIPRFEKDMIALWMEYPNGLPAG